MSAVVKAGVALAVLVAVLSLVLAFAGLHRNNPMVAQFAFLIPAILLNVGCVFWGLKMTAADNGYLKQLVNGLLIGLVAGVLIFAFSMLLLNVLMPDYLDEVKQSTIAWLEDSGLPDEQVESQIKSVEETTPVSQALAGLIGTFLTSLISGAIIAIFVRRK